MKKVRFNTEDLPGIDLLALAIFSFRRLTAEISAISQRWVSAACTRQELHNRPQSRPRHMSIQEWKQIHL